MNDQPHILVVDDHREIRDSVSRYLEGTSKNCRCAANWV